MVFLTLSLHSPQLCALSTIGLRLAPLPSRQLHVSFLTRQLMPPKKKTAVKRKAASESQSDDEATQSASKKAKVSKDLPGSAVASNGQPTNKVLPVNISFPPRISGTLRLSTWNICSLASASKKVSAMNSYCTDFPIISVLYFIRDLNSMLRRRIQTFSC